MGFFAGVVEELNRIEDKKERRELFKQKILEERKNTILPILMERVAKRTEAATERTGRVRSAMKKGFTKEVASILESRGDLDGILASIADKDVNTGAIQRLNESIIQDVPKENVAAAVKYAFDAGYAENPSVDTYIKAVYASTDEEFMSAATDLTRMGLAGSRPSLGAGPAIKTSALQAMDETRLGKIRGLVKERIELGLGVKPGSGMTPYHLSDPESAERVINAATEYYVSQVNDPLASRNPEDVLPEITEKVRAYSTAIPKLNEMADVLDFRISLEDISTLAPPPPPPGDTAEEDLLMPNGGMSGSGSSELDLIDLNYGG